MNLERANHIAGIASAVLAVVGIAWGVWTYFKPPETPAAPAQNVTPSPPAIKPDTAAIPLVTRPTGPSTPESEIASLGIGVSRAYLESKFGPPAIDNVVEGSQLRNLVFAFPRFHLQTVLSAQNAVIFYSVTTRSPEFRPTVPYLGGQLLQARFSDFGEAEHLYSEMSSKYYAYAEWIYLGNPGNYKNLYLGYCPAGVYPEQSSLEPVLLDRDGEKARKRFRNAATPNCFGIGAGDLDEQKMLTHAGFGVDYFTARELP